MAWRAGAELTQLEGKRLTGISRHPAYGTGNPRNTWYPCTIVDANGKEVPYVSLDGKTFTTFDQRVKPSDTGKRIIMPGLPTARNGKALDSDMPSCLSDRPEFDELVRKGEYKLPLYADITKMPEHERRVIFGLMVAEEGKTWIVYRNLTQAGFDPDKDLLQHYGDWFSQGGSLDATSRKWLDHVHRLRPHRRLGPKDDTRRPLRRGRLCLRQQLPLRRRHRGQVGWCARRRTRQKGKPCEVHQPQVEKDMDRVLAPTKRSEDIDWKDLNNGISTVLRTYFGDYVNEELLQIGRMGLNELEAKEAKELVAQIPPS